MLQETQIFHRLCCAPFAGSKLGLGSSKRIKRGSEIGTCVLEVCGDTDRVEAEVCAAKNNHNGKLEYSSMRQEGTVLKLWTPLTLSSAPCWFGYMFLTLFCVFLFLVLFWLWFVDVMFHVCCLFLVKCETLCSLKAAVLNKHTCINIKSSRVCCINCDSFSASGILG